MIVGDDATLVQRPWKVSPPIMGGLKYGQRIMNHLEFPLIWQQQKKQTIQHLTMLKLASLIETWRIYFTKNTLFLKLVQQFDVEQSAFKRSVKLTASRFRSSDGLRLLSLFRKFYQRKLSQFLKNRQHMNQLFLKSGEKEKKCSSIFLSCRSIVRIKKNILLPLLIINRTLPFPRLIEYIQNKGEESRHYILKLLIKIYVS